MQTEITQEQRARVAEIIMAGLVVGVGNPEPGKLCLESAICLALGEPHGDRSRCVASADRAFAIRINDRYPGTPEERAKLLLPLGLAHLGTAGTDRLPWVKRLGIGLTKRVLPIAFRRAAELHKDEAHKIALSAAADQLELEGTDEAVLAAREVSRAASADASADAYAYASTSASASADAYASASAYAYASADAYASGYAYASAYASAYAYASADAYALDTRRLMIETAVAVALEAYAVEGRS